MLDVQRPLRDTAYIGRDQVTHEARMRAVEPYPDYYDRRVAGTLIIAVTTLAVASLAEYFGLDIKPIRTVVENVGQFIGPAAIGAAAGTTHYVTRKD